MTQYSAVTVVVSRFDRLPPIGARLRRNESTSFEYESRNAEPAPL